MAVACRERQMKRDGKRTVYRGSFTHIMSRQWMHPLSTDGGKPASPLYSPLGHVHLQYIYTNVSNLYIFLQIIFLFLLISSFSLKCWSHRIMNDITLLSAVYIYIYMCVYICVCTLLRCCVPLGPSPLFVIAL